MFSFMIYTEKLSKNFVTEKKQVYETKDAEETINQAKPVECVMLHVLTNDVKKNTPTEVKENLEALITLTKRKMPRSKVIVSLCIPRGDDPELNDKQQYVNRLLIKDLAKQEDVSILHNKNFGRGHIPKYDLLAPDNIHLNKKGAQMFAENIKQAVSEALHLPIKEQFQWHAKSPHRWY